MAGNQVKKLNTKDNPLTTVKREYIANLAKTKLTSSKLYSMLWPNQQALALESILFKFIKGEFDYKQKTVKVDEDTTKEVYVFNHAYMIPGLEKEKDMTLEFEIEVDKKYLDEKKW